MWGISIYQLVVLLLILAPLIHVLVSSRSKGIAKFGWFVLVLIFWIFGYAAYLIVTRSSGRNEGAEGQA